MIKMIFILSLIIGSMAGVDQASAQTCTEVCDGPNGACRVKCETDITVVAPAPEPIPLSIPPPKLTLELSEETLRGIGGTPSENPMVAPDTPASEAAPSRTSNSGCDSVCGTGH